MRILSSIAAAALLAAAVASTPSWAKAPAEAYSLRGKVSDISMSPNGQFVAMLTQQGDQPVITISKIGGTTCKIGSGGSNILGIIWANNERLVAVAHKVAELAWDSSDNIYDFTQAYSIDTSCGNAQKLNGSQVFGRTPDGMLVMSVPTFNNSMSAERNTRRWRKHTGFKSDLHKVNPATGKGELFARGGDTTYDWLLDASGNPIMRFDADVSLGRILAYARLPGSGNWVLVYDQRDDPDFDNVYDFLAQGSRPGTAYVRTRNFTNRFGIYEFDFASKAIARPVFVKADADASGLVYDEYRQVPVGTGFNGDGNFVEYFDKDYAKFQADLKETFPGEKRSIRSVTLDRKAVIAYVEGSTNPGGIFHYIDVANGELIELMKARPMLVAADIGAVKFMRYAARDGYQIPAFLTLPNGSSGKGLPLIVLPHGGPESHDTDDFDAWTQFLASRGYAVLQPQFRGSTGFGKAHRDAGRRQWGLRMQDDITDGVKHLISTGVADGKRVCIVGWSYGGYAALAGLAFTPDLYKCGVAGAPVSDIPKMMEWAQKNGGRWFRDNDEIVRMIGNLKADYDKLVQTSPARNAGKIKAPLLLVHGRLDTTVPLEQSHFMVDAMKQANRPHELVVIDGDDHNLKKPATATQFLNLLEGFLGRHLN